MGVCIGIGIIAIMMLDNIHHWQLESKLDEIKCEIEKIKEDDGQ